MKLYISIIVVGSLVLTRVYSQPAPRTEAIKQTASYLGQKAAAPFKAVGKLFEKVTWADPVTGKERTTTNLTRHVTTAKNYLSEKSENLANKWEARGNKSMTDLPRIKKVEQAIKKYGGDVKNIIGFQGRLQDIKNTNSSRFSQSVTPTDVHLIKELEADIAKTNKSNFVTQQKKEKLANKFIVPIKFGFEKLTDSVKSTYYNLAEKSKYAEAQKGEYKYGKEQDLKDKIDRVKDKISKEKFQNQLKEIVGIEDDPKKVTGAGINAFKKLEKKIDKTITQQSDKQITEFQNPLFGDSTFDGRSIKPRERAYSTDSAVSLPDVENLDHMLPFNYRVSSDPLGWEYN